MAKFRATDRTADRYREIAGAIGVLALGLLARLWLITRFPVIPISDFANLVGFGQHIHRAGLTSGTGQIYWQLFSPGMPAVLAAVFTVFPSGDTGALARLTTALFTALLPLFPYVVWRGVLPHSVRLIAAFSLALWPGQVFYSGIVAQDNWVLVPTVALGALAVRALISPERRMPILAGLVYAAAVSFRSDALFTLLPLFLAALRVDLLLRS